MNELIKQIRKQINPPRKSASETRYPFRSRVINGASKKEDRRRETIGFEIPVTRGASDKKKEAPMTLSITKQQTALAVMSCETWITKCTYAGKLESASNLTNPGLGETA